MLALLKEIFEFETNEVTPEFLEEGEFFFSELISYQKYYSDAFASNNKSALTKYKTQVKENFEKIGVRSVNIKHEENTAYSSCQKKIIDYFKNDGTAGTGINAKAAFLLKLKNVDIATLVNNRFVGLWESLGTYKEPDFEFDTRYHYISIHQGILDKLYNKRKERELDKPIFFKIVLEKLKEKAMGKCIIHTGRGKPNYIEQIMAFRSLSDLDYAIKEPKEILLDYFLSASYE
jgi:hypothetical protein